MFDDIQSISSSFDENLKSVYDLINFDDAIIKMAILGLTSVNERIKKRNINNPIYLLDRTIQQFEKIRENKTLKPKYDLMLNQCIVLLVSYFGSTIEEIFKTSLSNRLIHCDLGKLHKEELKITLGELSDHHYNHYDSIGEVVTNSKEISFQDMQSIGRAFKEFFEISIEKNKLVNNIIMSQACRHVIVHTSSIVSEKMMRQISQSVPRDFKQIVKLNEKIQFSEEEVRIVGASMKEYVENVISKLNEWYIQNCLLF